MNHKQLFSLLENYGSISKSEKESVIKNFKPIEAKKNEILIDNHSECDKLFFINKGCVRIYYINKYGREITKNISFKNQFITNLSSFKNLESNDSILQCLDNTSLLCINRDEFEKIINSSQFFKNVYIKILEDCNVSNVKHVKILGSRDIKQKFVYLKTYFPKLLYNFNDNILASFIGVSRENFTKNKKYF